MLLYIYRTHLNSLNYTHKNVFAQNLGFHHFGKLNWLVFFFSFFRKSHNSDFTCFEYIESVSVLTYVNAVNIFISGFHISMTFSVLFCMKGAFIQISILSNKFI